MQPAENEKGAIIIKSNDFADWLLSHGQCGQQGSTEAMRNEGENALEATEGACLLMSPNP